MKTIGIKIKHVLKFKINGGIAMWWPIMWLEMPNWSGVLWRETWIPWRTTPHWCLRKQRPTGDMFVLCEYRRKNKVRNKAGIMGARKQVIGYAVRCERSKEIMGFCELCKSYRERKCQKRATRRSYIFLSYFCCWGELTGSEGHDRGPCDPWERQIMA
jgi:hypothetical protein